MMIKRPSGTYCLLLLLVFHGVQGSEGELQLQAFAQANNRFAIQVYKELSNSAGRHRNVVFSPLGVSTGLAMSLLSARGMYPDQLRHVLRLDALDRQTLYPSVRTLLSSLQTEECACRVASKAFLSDKYNYKRQFEVDARLFFGSPPERLNFSKIQTAKERISEWTEVETGKTFQQVLEPETLGAQIDLVLASAVSLEGKWEYKIRHRGIKDGAFYTLSGGKALTVDVLSQRGTFPYAAVKELDCQVAELPLAGNKLKMVIVLPRKRAGLLELEKILEFEHLKLLRNTQETMIDILLPKFALEESRSLEEVIKSLGVQKLVLPTEDEDVEVSHVVHNARVGFGEDGVKPTADVKQMPATRIIVTRPFLFYVQHVESEAIVLMGRVMDPSLPSPPSQTGVPAERPPKEEL